MFFFVLQCHNSLKLYNFIFKNNVKKYYYGTQIIKEALGAHIRPYGYTYRTLSRDAEGGGGGYRAPVSRDSIFHVITELGRPVSR